MTFRALTTGARSGTYSYSVGSTGSVASFSTLVTGVSPTDTWTAQTSWNLDAANGSSTLPTLVQTNGNVYAIRYQWLGFGDIQYLIENPTSGLLIPVHHILYSNSNTSTSVANPIMGVSAYVENTSNTSAVIIKTPSISIFNEGKRRALGITRSLSNTNNIDTTNSNILSIRVVPTFQSIENKVRIKLLRISAGSDSTKVSLFRATLNGVLAGSATWTVVDSTSIVQYATVETTLTGGRQMHDMVVGATGGRDYSFVDNEFYLYPNDILIVSGNVVSGAASDLTVGISWIEEF